MPDARLLRFGRGHRTFATQRFDRTNRSRRLYASAMTLLMRDDGDSGSYLDLAQAIQIHGDPAGIVDDLKERAAIEIDLAFTPCLFQALFFGASQPPCSGAMSSRPVI